MWQTTSSDETQKLIHCEAHSAQWYFQEVAGLEYISYTLLNECTP